MSEDSYTEVTRRSWGSRIGASVGEMRRVEIGPREHVQTVVLELELPGAP